ncbi:MAG: DNA alkylation repair protein [Bacteroidales bacterium]|nr:DNA alkylation repair protein [Bacteroidales bacterium]
MVEDKFNEIQGFFAKHVNLENIAKYSRYFKDGFKGYGIDQKTFEEQKEHWIETWKDEMSLDDYLDLGELLVQTGNYEEASLAIMFVASRREQFTPATFDRLGKWFSLGMDNWANTDVLCMLVLKNFMLDKVIDYPKLASWSIATSEWQRRTVPVTLNELIKTGLTPDIALPLVEPLMMDGSEYVQKGIGTLLRGLWKKYPDDIEAFLLQWKDHCGRLIISYATEKMDKEKRRKFARSK